MFESFKNLRAVQTFLNLPLGTFIMIFGILLLGPVAYITQNIIAALVYYAGVFVFIGILISIYESE